MKCFVTFCALLYCVYGKHLPAYISDLTCRKYDPDFSKCALESLEKFRPYMSKGIPELGITPIDPLEIPLITSDRNFSDIISIKAAMSNVKTTGFSRMIIEDFKADPVKLAGELRITLPHSETEMDYDMVGHMFAVPLNNKGHFSGNFNDTVLVFKIKMKTVERGGVEYFKVDKFDAKVHVGSCHIGLTADEPEMQFAANLIADFSNENQRLVLDAVSPILAYGASDVFVPLLNQRFSKSPAKEFLPE